VYHRYRDIVRCRRILATLSPSSSLLGRYLEISTLFLWTRWLLTRGFLHPSEHFMLFLLLPVISVNNTRECACDPPCGPWYSVIEHVLSSRCDVADVVAAAEILRFRTCSVQHEHWHVRVIIRTAIHSPWLRAFERERKRERGMTTVRRAPGRNNSAGFCST